MAGIFLSHLTCNPAAYGQTGVLPLAGNELRLAAFDGSGPTAFSAVSNAAALASSKEFSAGMYAERRFLIRELSAYRLAYGIPSASGSFAATIDYFGYTAFNQTILHIAYGRKLAPSLDAGIRFNYGLIKAGSYGTGSALGADVAILFHVNQQLLMGMQVENLAGKGRSDSDGPILPPAFVAGAGCRLSEKLFWGAVLRKEQEKPLDFLTGLSFDPDPQLTITAGVGTTTASFYLGASFSWQHIHFTVSASIHPVLGVTPGLLILYKAATPQP